MEADHFNLRKFKAIEQLGDGPYRDQFVGILSHDLRSPLSAIAAGAAASREVQRVPCNARCYGALLEAVVACAAIGSSIVKIHP